MSWWEGGMSPAEYRRLIDQWRRNRLTWTAADIKHLQAKVRRIVKREKDGSIR